MPVISGQLAPVFAAGAVSMRGLAAPSRGAREICAWRVSMPPDTPATPHMLDREEVFVVLSGRASVTLEAVAHDLVAGDALIVPPRTTFSLCNPHSEPLEMVAVLPSGGHAIVPGQPPFTPPWTV